MRKNDKEHENLKIFLALDPSNYRDLLMIKKLQRLLEDFDDRESNLKEQAEAAIQNKQRNKAAKANKVKIKEPKGDYNQ